MKKVILFVACFINFSLSVVSQEHKAVYHLLHTFNGENGLPQNTIRDIYFSPSGFLWLATENGLVRYDGKKFNVCTKANYNITSNRFAQFLPTANGLLYTINELGDIYLIQESFLGIQLKYVQKTPDMGFSVYHPFELNNIEMISKIKKLLVNENISDAFYYSFLKLDNQFIQKTTQGIIIYDSLLNKKDLIPFALTIQSELLIIENTLVLRLKNKFFKVDIQHKKITPLSSTIPASANTIDSRSPVHNNYFIWDPRNKKAYKVYDNKIYTVTLENNILNYHFVIEQPAGSPICAISQSTDQSILFLGTLSDGIHICRKAEFKVITSPHCANIYYAQALNPENHSMITSRPAQEITPTKQSILPLYSNIDYLTLHIQGNSIWYAYSDTVGQYNLKTKKKYEIQLSENQFDHIGIIDSSNNHNVLVLTSNKIYQIDEENQKKILATFPPHRKQNRIYSKIETPLGMLIGSADGVYEYNKSTGRILMKYLKGKTVRSIFRSKNGHILFGTYGDGYYILHNNQAIQLPTDKNNSLLSVHAFIEDKFENIWMSTNNGLYKIPLKDIVRYASDTQDVPLYYYRFSHVDGLATNEFNGGCYPSVVQVDSAYWSLPSMKGLVWFAPNQMQTRFSSSDLSIDHILLDNVPITLDTDRTIHIKDHRFQLSCFLSSPNWSDDNNLYIEYQLVGSKEVLPWVLLKDNNAPVIIQNLKGGRYELRLRKRSDLPKGRYTYQTIYIEVAKKIYEYFWFWPATFFALLLLIWGFNRYTHYRIQQRKNLLERLVGEKTIELKDAILKLENQALQLSESKVLLQKENELKSNLLYVLSHDIAMPLRFINRFLKFLQGGQEEKALQKEDLNELQISTQQLESLLGNLVAWIKQTDQEGIQPQIESIALYELIQEQASLFQLICKKKNITILNNVDSQCILRSDRFIISRAVLNVLGNAVNHSNHGNIEIQYVKQNEFHEIHIRDNASNLNSMVDTSSENHEFFNQPRAGFGIGIKITQTLLNIIGGRIKSIKPDSGFGTDTIIYICHEN